MENMAEAQKAKSKANKAKKQQDRLTKNKSMVDQFKRAQRHLGLRESLQDQPPTQIAQSAAIDPLIPAPFAFDRSVIFVCVDVESYERAHHKITEVGIATLDTRDLVGIAPGENGKAWREMIRARHFRINEHRHLVNSDFVTGHPDGFIFGESTFIPLNEAANHVAACFRAPFGAQVNTGEEATGHIPSDLESSEKRNIIFLGHDTLGDVRYLQQLGYDPIKEENILEAMDTATMYCVWHRDQQPTRLGKILSDFDIIGWKLHNAGNDAVYTVQAMLGICVREATIRGSPELDELREKEKEARLAAAREDAEQKARDDAAGWSDHEADGDGGRPVPLAPKPMPAQSKSKGIPQYDGPSEMESTGERGHGWSLSRRRASERGRGNRPASAGRGQMEGRARARGRGRAQQRGRERESSNPSANTADLASIPQVCLQMTAAARVVHVY
jgi:hypothetical protein